MLINKIVLRIFNSNYSKALNSVFQSEGELFKKSSNVQQKKLKLMLRHCIQNVPFYQDLKYEKQVSIFDFPIVDKKIINKNFQDFLAENISVNRRKKNSTSGSTGTNFHFFSDNYTDVYRHAFVNLGEQWSGANLNQRKLIIWGAERDIWYSFKKKLINSRFLFNSKIISSYHMTDADIDNIIIPTINNFIPSVIVGYPSSLAHIADYLTRNKICLNHHPKGIITSGESLSDLNRIKIENAFGAKVFNRYGCRDVGAIAHECEAHEGMHVFSDHVFIEIINEMGEPCKPGEIGEIVVTDLDNYVFPFVRYKIGDIGRWGVKECKCGRKLPLLESVEGRTFDLILGTNNNKVPGNYFSILSRKVKGIDQFQIIQEKVGFLEVRLKVNAEYQESNDEKLISIMKDKLGNEMIIKVNHVPKIDSTISGKFRWVISKINIYES